MASNNNLLGSGKPVVEVKESVVTSVLPKWMYHKDFPEGKIVRTEDELEELEVTGWEDHPGKVRLLPGHEKLFKETVSKIDVSQTKKDKK